MVFILVYLLYLCNLWVFVFFCCVLGRFLWSFPGALSGLMKVHYLPGKLKIILVVKLKCV